VGFPNFVVVEETVFDYTRPLFPYIWSEIRFPIAYDADL